MNEVNDLLAADWENAIRVIFIIMAGLIAIHKVCTEFWTMVKKLARKLRGLDPNPKNKEQDEEIARIKQELEELKKMVKALKKNSMINSWDRVIHFGMNYLRDGHVSYYDMDIFTSEVDSYQECGGNGHLKKFVPMVKALPYTEDLTEDQRIAIEDDDKSRVQRIKSADAALKSYYDEAHEKKDGVF